MTPASAAVSTIVGELGLVEGFRLGRIKSRWRAIAGEEAAMHTEPVSLRSGELMVNADSPSRVNQMTYRRAELLASLAGYGINNVRFKTGAVARRDSKAGAAENPLKKTPSKNDIAFIDETVSQIADPALASHVRTAMFGWAARWAALRDRAEGRYIQHKERGYDI